MNEWVEAPWLYQASKGWSPSAAFSINSEPMETFCIQYIPEVIWLMGRLNEQSSTNKSETKGIGP
ncbi:hypothetical protein AB2S62_18355 [Vibrio sp. NTOU-M3]|uniref:hypothetical protein n=1 Tax=Vibrio sp. NTOU-M3 TaxID=3234954 RepID=UPI00349FAB41